MSWREQAKCRGMDPAMFHPDRGDKAGLAAAKEVCANCPVRRECREAGLSEPDGVWGGAAPGTRRRERARRQREHGYEQKVCPVCANRFTPRNGFQVYCTQQCFTVNRRRVWRERARLKWPGTMLDEGHGRPAKYGREKCRCEACRAAATERRFLYRRQKQAAS